jgi:hypothetical protein
MASLAFIELPYFTKRLYDYLSEESFQDLQDYLSDNPVAAKGHGKRGGARVIYFYAAANGVIWLMSIYPKNEDENISLDLLQQLRQQIDD